MLPLTNILRKNCVAIQLTTTRNVNNNQILREYQSQQSTLLQKARSFEEIPSPPKQWIKGHQSVFHQNMSIQHKFHNEMRKTYGNMVWFSALG